MFLRREGGKWTWGLGSGPPCDPKDGWRTFNLWPVIVIAFVAMLLWLR